MTTTDPAAPHGRDSDGTPLAPYGLKTDGTPRLSRRGARPGQRGNGGRGGKRSASGSSAPKRPAVSRSNVDKVRRANLVELTRSLTSTMVGVALSPQVRSRIGERQSCALAGDAVIIDSYAEPLADALVVLSQSKPGVLSWLDRVEDKAPYLMLAHVGIQLTKALVASHLEPSERLANAAVLMVRTRAEAMAADIERQASEMGVPLWDDVDQVDADDVDQVAA